MAYKGFIEFRDKAARENFDIEYRKSLRHSIRNKLYFLKEEIKLLEHAGFKVTENYNSVTGFNNPQINSNQASFRKNKAGPMGFEPMTFSLEG